MRSISIAQKFKKLNFKNVDENHSSSGCQLGVNTLEWASWRAFYGALKLASRSQSPFLQSLAGLL